MTDHAPAAPPPSQSEAVLAAPKRPRGRPRRPDVDRAILEATLDAFIQDGYEGMSVDGVAERAGVAKATVYRRWPSKQELLIAAGQHLYEEHVHFPDRGELRQDLDLDLAVASLVGTVIFLHLLGRLRDMPPDLPERLVAQLLEGIGASRPQARG